MSGFYSKDLILEIGISNNFRIFGLSVFIISVAFTVFYSVRMILILLISDRSSSLEAYDSLNFFLFFSTLGLGLGAVWGGFIFQVCFKQFNKFVFVSSNEKFLILICIVFSMGLIVFSYLKERTAVVNRGWFYRFFRKIFFLPFLSGNFMRRFFLKESIKLVLNVEKG